MRETWYVLEDGKMADPNEVAPDANGKLRHKGGVAVAMRGDVPSTRGVDADEARAKPDEKPAAKTKEAVAAKPKASGKDREMKAGGAKKYETR